MITRWPSACSSTPPSRSRLTTGVLTVSGPGDTGGLCCPRQEGPVPIHVASRRRRPASLRAVPLAEIIDVTSKAPEPWVRLSPFYPHGGIPVPYSDGVISQSVEGIWQALKVFKDVDVDPSKLEITTMKALKRTVAATAPSRATAPACTATACSPTRRPPPDLPARPTAGPRKPRSRPDRATTHKNDVVLLDYTTNADVSIHQPSLPRRPDPTTHRGPLACRNLRPPATNVVRVSRSMRAWRSMTCARTVTGVTWIFPAFL